MDGSCCAQRSDVSENRSRLDALSWASSQFGEADLGDLRRESRLIRLAAAIAENASMTLPKQCASGADLAAAYRFLSNPEVDPQDILGSHCRMVRQEALEHRLVLCIADDTELDFTHRSSLSGVGQIGDGRGRGLLQHSTLAVLPDGRVLGLLDVAWHAPQRAPENETKLQRQRRWNLSDLWPEAVQRIGLWESAGKLVHVGDRHADLFRHLSSIRSLGQEFLVRAMHDRKLPDHQRRLWGTVQSQPSLGTMRLSIGKQRDHRGRVSRKGREAEVTLRSVRVELSPPPHDPRTAGWEPLAVWAVYLKEENPPAGLPQEQVIDWMLLSSLDAPELESARKAAQYYALRWRIEEWHRCYKQGCAIEASQLDDAEDIQRLGAVLCVVAVRLLQLRDMADEGHPNGNDPAALKCMFPPLYVQVVARLAGERAEDMTPRRFLLQVAKQGGYLGRKNDPRPGWLVLWRGWNDIVQMVRGIEIYQRFIESRKDV